MSLTGKENVLLSFRMMAMTEVVDFETYAARGGADRADMGDLALAKRGRNQTDKQWNRIIANQVKRDDVVMMRRNELREEYQLEVEAGRIRPPSRVERLKATAAGHPDNDSTQAARRILERMGESW